MVEAQAAGLPCVISSNVPKETVLIPELVESLSLSEPVELWSEKILRMKSIKRVDTSGKIKDSGFDIEESAKWLEKFYYEKTTNLK